jgi:cell division septation protein DedD
MAAPAGHTGGTMLVNSADIQVMEDLNRKYRGWYMIHISSFQTSTRARDEVAFLESHEFPVFIVFLDLGPKGKWYRVYAGPFQTREEAADVKKNLDAVPQVRFTRIATIPD